MKVIGSGSPTSLTLRLREREVSGLNRELDRRKAIAGENPNDGAEGTVALSATQVRAEIVAARRRLDGAVKLVRARVEVTGSNVAARPGDLRRGSRGRRAAHAHHAAVHA
jgi:hypothetical protein